MPEKRHIFFLQNCPNPRMDGDNDGIPCEKDSRFPPLNPGNINYLISPLCR
ncbi:excalibur calcium-binding domain-containing protein [Pectobacterium versatile]|uniref:excalibur calcium-binding domain-containing protein n=1 Tax=Pectobacterium versatile TaxID=2488639 RepID=UPI002E7ABDB2|nr:excalibur calcium-binding domain-containing protein [Pectobacterium versatile]